MRISLIVALSENHVIGRNNKLPWYLPNDLKYFKQVTMGLPIVMGRKTFESIGKPLPGRTNIVVTRNTDWSADGVRAAHSLEEAFELAESIAEIDGREELMIIGGDQIYQSALPLVDRMYLTEVHAHVDGDAYFPKFDPADWHEIGREDFSAADPNPYDYSFVVYDRK
ncbi:dihydrofolate reductase [Oleiphilus sp. HI0079]|uniref:dihydrofolate reductase n=1 Tax=Oleiphilus sp. HI0079 TaxID=1822254 RepID=UPI0007C21A60|nr:dihydrofolate reductase [Oleiphilus sp. HI0079]KZZ13944.1 dihydrofolate reductase [Oleiphilus sp. HI0079]